MTVRRRLSATRRDALFDANHGKCYLCAQPIKPGEAWEVEHVLALTLGGADDESNMALAHVACHKPKTARDVGIAAKADRQRQRHIGIKKAPTFWRPPGLRYDWKRRGYVRD